MSTIRFSDNRLVFRAGDREEEVGYLEESGSGECVLWLKDIFGLLSDEGEAYYRADEYASMSIAKFKAVGAVSVQIWHLIWLRQMLKATDRSSRKEQLEKSIEKFIREYNLTMDD